MRHYIFIAVLSVFLLPVIAYAQCANPHAEMGVLIFNKAHKVMQYCNGDDWIGIWGGGGGTGGATLPSCTDGEIAQFTNGTWTCNNGSGLANLNASNLASGTVPRARLGTGTANNTSYLRGDGTWASPPAADLSNLNASNLTSGTVPNARLGSSGTRNTTTFLRGDNTWAAPPAGGGITEAILATCVSPSGSPWNCTVNCPAQYFRTGCNNSSSGVTYPAGANGCYCYGATATCYAHCAR